MRMSELSERSGVPIATVKFYLREGLLAPGSKSSRNQAQYDEGHLARLRMIRAFIDVAGVSIATARGLLRAIDDTDLSPLETVGEVSRALTTTDLPPGEAGRQRIAEVVRARGWAVDEDNPGWNLAARVIDDYLAFGRGDLAATLDSYAEAAERVAEADLPSVLSEDRAAMTEGVVLGTVLGEVLFAGLRRMAHESVARRLLAD